MARLLVTGFEPFGGERVNPSGYAAERLVRDGFSGVEASFLVLPVVRYRCIELAVEAIERERPDAVVMLGQAGGRGWITPERVAINVDDYRRPDNAGNQPVDQEIIAGGPAAHFSTLPVKQMVGGIRAAGVPASLSNTAGTFLCNHLSYGVLHHLALRRLPIRAGFVHLPYLPEQAVDKEAQVACMGLETLLLGLRAAVSVVIETVTPALATV
jgi:pyroglutamyl-peptidase